MRSLLKSIQELVAQGNVRISDHGYDELAENGILARDVVAALPDGETLEDYPDVPKGLAFWFC